MSRLRKQKPDRSLKIGVATTMFAALVGCTGVGNIDSADQLGLSAVPEQTAPNQTEPLPPPVVPEAASPPVSITQDSAAVAAPDAPKPLPDDDLYAGLPEGPKNTGTFPNFSEQPEARIINPSEEEVDQIITQLEALEAAQRAGSVSPAQYAKRLSALKRLAASHSPAMLRRIESRQ